MVASAAPDDRTLVMTHTFDAAPARVFAAWTDPKQFAEWFGPHGMKNTHCRFDLRVGGTWELTGEGLGTKRAISGRYLAIDPPRFCPSPGPGTRAAVSTRRASTRRPSLWNSSLWASART